MPRLYLILLVLFVFCQNAAAQVTAQFRGPDRNGVFPETGLLKSWIKEGPELLWSTEDLDNGYASVSVTDEAIYLTGRKDSLEYLTALDLNGNRLWRIPFGLGVKRSYPETRCTPTVEGDRIFLISGRGEVVCIDKNRQQVLWSVPALEKFQGEFWVWEVAESPLLVDDKVIYTPGGHLTTLVAFDKISGETVWQTESIHDTTAFVSPILIEFGMRKIIVNVLINDIIGVDAANGEILWRVRYSEIEPPTAHPFMPHNNCITPLYHEGSLFVTSGYDHVGVMFRLLDDGKNIEQVWINRDLDCHHGQVVRVGKYIYGANWIDNRHGNWCCVDWETGQTMYEETWHNKGSVSAADGMLYCYEEKTGNLALVEAVPEDFRMVSSFQITRGNGPHWSQPVICDGVLYIRHGQVLMAYRVGK